MAENVVHTISPGASIPLGYFDWDNINFIQHKIAAVLSQEYIQQIIVSHSDIIRVMQRVLEERRENVPKMNQRVIMYICNDFRTHQIEVNRNYRWEEGYYSSQLNIDPVGQIERFDHRSIKTNGDVKYDGKTRVGGTLRFHFT